MSKTLFYNARIWRHCGKLYEWVLFDNISGRIIRCGNGDAPLNDTTKMLDLKQQWVFPGFHDSHLHIGSTGQFLNEKFNLGFPNSVDELKKRLKDRVCNISSNQKWFVGFGWNHHTMDRMPTVEDLDEVAPHNPVILMHVSVHICVVNSIVLSLICSNRIESVDDSCIGRFENNHHKAGKPNGLLFEDEGFKLVKDIIPDLSSEEKKENILVALQKCLQEGITSVHPCEDSHWNEYVSLAKASMLPIHCYYSPFSTNINSSNFPSKPKESYENLSCDIVKVFIDGALGTKTAALSVPYINDDEDDAQNYGMLQKSEEEFARLFAEINDAGFRLEIHVIGDRAVDVALNALISSGVAPSSRPIFVHCQILSESLIDRMLQCGVVPTIQPSFVPTDAKWIEQTLPSQLRRCIYPWKTLLDRGIICGGSSDSPVETTNPLQGIYDAIFRPSSDETPFIESECLSFSEAVALYTTGSAYADFAETHKGQIEVGFQADFVVLDVPAAANGMPDDISLNPKLLKETKVKEVWVKGKQSI